MKRGWFLVHRGWMASPDFQAEPFTEREAFLWSIEQAAFEAHDQWFNKAQFPVGRGEFITSSRKMASAFQWGEKRVRLFTARMVKRQKWAQRETHLGAHGPTILTVCNYERFQTLSRAEGAAMDAAEGAGWTQVGRSQGAQQNEGLKKGNEGEGREIEEASPSPSRTPDRPYSKMVAMWSQAAAIKGWKPLNPQLNDDRRKGLAKIHDTHGLEGWRHAIQQALDSAFLGGPDPPGWFNFGFLSNPKKFLNVLEGNYSASFSGNRNEQRSSWLDANEKLSGGLPSFGGTVSEAQSLLVQR